jgi:hypothetical protein
VTTGTDCASAQAAATVRSVAASSPRVKLRRSGSLLNNFVACTVAPLILRELPSDNRLIESDLVLGKQVYSNRVGRRCGDGGLANLGNAR